MSMNIKSGFMALALRIPSSPFSAEAVLKPCFSRAFCMTNTSVGESSTMRMSAILGSPSFADVGFDRTEELVLGERLGQVVLRAHDTSAGAVEKAVLARQHDHRNLLEHLVVLDERARLVTVEPRHHDVHEHDVGLVVRDLGERVEPVDGGE